MQVVYLSHPSISYNEAVKKHRRTIVIAIGLIILCVFLYSKKISAPGGIFSQKTSKTSVTAPGFDKSKHSNSDPASIWVVVNKKRPLNPLTYAPADLTNVGGNQQLRKDAASALTSMFAAAANEKLILKPLSGYRSYATQVTVYNREVATNGKAIADTQSAQPGKSEHQTGWAIDIGGGGCGIEDCFGNTKEGKWVAANGYKYGFIIRYTAGKEAITGYRAEPWHIRYIGIELATEMHTKGTTTLEEFFGL